MALRNVTETLTRVIFDDTFLHSGQLACDCPQCQEDILAYALNRLPAHYVTSDLGQAYVKAQYLSSQMQLDILRELTIAAHVVGTNPRHRTHTEIHAGPQHGAGASDVAVSGESETVQEE
jgi:competence protein ComFB